MSRQQIDFPLQQAQVATPAAPPAGAMKLYPKTDDKFYQLTPAGVETVIGGGVSDPLTIGRIILTSGTDMANPAITLNNSAYIGAKDNTGAIRPVLEATGDNWNAFHAGPNGLTFVNYLNTVRVGGISNAGNMNINAVATNSVTITGPLNVSGGRSAMVYADGLPIGTATGSGGALEIQSNTGNAAMIAFHRAGAYAAYFGVDTDNQWKVGGWSMGAVSYRLLTTGDGTPSVAASGGSLVKRDANGYITNTYINLSADVQGGAPVYVAGQNGDGYLRWYPKSLVGPPALVQKSWSGTMAINPGGWTPAIATDRAGYWMYYVTCDTTDAESGSGDRYVECNVRLNYASTIASHRYPTDHTGGKVHFGFGYMTNMANGTVFDVNVGTYYVGYGTWTIYTYLWFIPTA